MRKRRLGKCPPPRITYLDIGNTGLTGARKLLADIAQGKLLALMDSDDFWSPERLQRHVDVWNHNLIGLSWDRWARSDGIRRRVFPQPFSPGLIPAPKVAQKLYSWNFIHASAGVVSARFARKEGFPIFEITSSDWPLFMRAAQAPVLLYRRNVIIRRRNISRKSHQCHFNLVLPRGGAHNQATVSNGPTANLCDSLS